MGDFKNEFCFSESRASMLETCPRRFWYYVYRSWNGWWSSGRPPEDQESEGAYWAKHAETTATLSGHVVHEAAAWGLKTAIEGREWTQESIRPVLLKRAAKALDKAFDLARGRKGQHPKKSTRLIEVEFGLPFDEEECRDRTRDRLMALTATDDGWGGDVHGANLYVRALQRPQKIVHVDEPVSWRYQLPDGTVAPVFLAADLVMRTPDGRGVVVLDWKTGKKRQKDNSQIVQYGAWAAQREFESIEMLLVYLDEESKTTVVKVSHSIQDSIRMAALKVETFAKDLATRLVDGDLQRNEAIEERFTPTADARECRLCPFQGICERDGTRPGPVAPQ